MNKAIISAICMLAFTSAAADQSNAGAANAAICSITLYKEDPTSQIGSSGGTIVALANSQYILSSCSDPKESFDWAQLFATLVPQLDANGASAAKTTAAGAH